jgi:hypothetical protein
MLLGSREAGKQGRREAGKLGSWEAGKLKGSILVMVCL